MNATATALRKIPDDWFPGKVPSNVLVGEGAYIETSYTFVRYRSRAACGLFVGRGAALYAPLLDVGPQGKVTIGEFALISSAMILSDVEVTIGPMTMLAWGVAVIDSYRGARVPSAASGHGETTHRRESAPRPVKIGANAWLGFECCVLPGVTIGDGSVVAARAVVVDDVPANTLVAGNPARVVRQL